MTSKSNEHTEGKQTKTGILKKSSIVVPVLPEGFVPKSRLKQEVKVSTEPEIRDHEAKSNLPSGFFDETVSLSIQEEVSAASDEEPDTMPEGDVKKKTNKDLPEGFFDDAKADAKARKVEYKDPQEAEWEKFQSEMEHEDLRYNDIIEVDDQKLREERDVEIKLEQKLFDYRVESISTSAKTGDYCEEDKRAFEVKLGNVEKKEEGVKEEEMTVQETLDVKMEESDEETEDDGVMDWRTKRGI